MPKAARNSEVARGVNRLGRAAMSKKRRFVIKKKGPVANKQQEEKKVETSTKEPRWYSGEDKSTPIPSRKANHKPTRLRSSITPGTVLILVAGKFRAKRVVFLKQLESGLLLVTGPYKVNGVPLRRVNQRFVIATSTKLDVSKVNVADVTDAFFKRDKKPKKKGGEFFDDAKAAVAISQEQKDTQKRVDTAVLSSIDKLAKQYLNARFTLTKGQYPHQMKF